MRTNPTTEYKKQQKEAMQRKIDFYSRKAAIAFVVFILGFLFLKMLLPSSV